MKCKYYALFLLIRAQLDYDSPLSAILSFCKDIGMSMTASIVNFIIILLLSSYRFLIKIDGFDTLIVSIRICIDHTHSNKYTNDTYML